MGLNQKLFGAHAASGHRQRHRDVAGFSSLAQLRRTVANLRARLEPAFGPETATEPPVRPLSASAGQCGAVATIVREMLGGQLVSADVDAQSHWFNRIPVAGDVFDVDLTGDQFGLPPVQLARGGRLYSGSRVRHLDEVDQNTRRRAMLLARRAGVSGDPSSDAR